MSSPTVNNPGQHHECLVTVGSLLFNAALQLGRYKTSADIITVTPVGLPKVLSVDQHRILSLTQVFRTIFTLSVTCTQCGQLLIESLSTAGEMKLTISFGDPQTLLGASPRELITACMS